MVMLSRHAAPADRCTRCTARGPGHSLTAYMHAPRPAAGGRLAASPAPRPAPPRALGRRHVACASAHADGPTTSNCNSGSSSSGAASQATVNTATGPAVTTASSAPPPPAGPRAPASASAPSPYAAGQLKAEAAHDEPPTAEARAGAAAHASTPAAAHGQAPLAPQPTGAPSPPPPPPPPSAAGQPPAAQPPPASGVTSGGAAGSGGGGGGRFTWPALAAPYLFRASADDVQSGAAPCDLSPLWKVLLLSDGSVTRHLQLLTGSPVTVECLSMRHVGWSLAGFPPATRLIPGPRVQRQVLLRCQAPPCSSAPTANGPAASAARDGRDNGGGNGSNGHNGGVPLVYASSWWNAAAVDEYLRDKSQPIWISLSQGHVELYREVHELLRSHGGGGGGGGREVLPHGGISGAAVDGGYDGYGSGYDGYDGEDGGGDGDDGAAADAPAGVGGARGGGTADSNGSGGGGRGGGTTLEELLGCDGPFWGRWYIFWSGGKPLTLIYEVFSPRLSHFLGPELAQRDL